MCALGSIAVIAGEGTSYVTCGSLIKLENAAVKTKAACQEVTYGGSGSGQHAVTGVLEDGSDTQSR